MVLNGAMEQTKLFSTQSALYGELSEILEARVGPNTMFDNLIPCYEYFNDSMDPIQKFKNYVKSSPHISLSNRDGSTCLF